MAVRLHVAAARSSSAEDFRAAFEAKFGERFENAEIVSEGGWQYFVGSVWSVGGSELDEALQALDGPTLRVTTEDACRWYLLLDAKDEERYVLCHEFSMYDDEEDEDEAADAAHFERVAFLQDPESDNVQPPPDPVEELIGEYAEMSSPLPTELVERVRGMPIQEAGRVIRDGLAEATADALARFKIPHDREAIVGCLTGRTVTEGEMDADIGNLPRFMVALGFEGQLQETFDNQTSPQYEEELEEEECRRDRDEERRQETEAALKRFADIAPEPMEGGPVSLPLERMVDVQSLGWFCDEFVDMIAQATLPEGTSFSPGEAEWGWSGMVNGLPTMRCDYGRPIVVDEDVSGVWTAFEGLPDGSTLRVVTVGDPEDADANAQAAMQVYDGKVKGGEWHVTATHPAVSAKALNAALELVDELRKAEGHVVTEAEASAIVEASTQLAMLADTPVKHADGRIWVDDEWGQPLLALLVFRHRHSDSWDTDTWAEEDRLAAEQWAQVMADLPQVPKLEANEVLLKAKQATYYHVDASGLPEGGIQALERRDQQMAELGLEPFGDLVASVAEGVVVRGYAGESGESYGVAMQAVDGQSFAEFYTRFADGSSLTTTNNYGAEMREEVGVFLRIYDEWEPERLIEKHRDGIARISGHRKTEPVTQEPTILAMAEALEEFLERRASSDRGYETFTFKVD